MDFLSSGRIVFQLHDRSRRWVDVGNHTTGHFGASWRMLRVWRHDRKHRHTDRHDQPAV